MASLWQSDEPVPPDLRGFTVTAADGEVGLVESDASGAGWRCLVVMQNRPSPARRIAVPAGMVLRVDRSARVLLVGPSRAYFLDGPALAEGDDPAAEDLRMDVGAYYASLMDCSAPVLPVRRARG